MPENKGFIGAKINDNFEKVKGHGLSK